MRLAFETNVLGPIMVINAVIHLLRNAASPRIVNVASAMGLVSELADRDSAFAEFTATSYQLTKAVLNALTVLQAREFRAEGITERRRSRLP